MTSRPLRRPGFADVTDSANTSETSEISEFPDERFCPMTVRPVLRHRWLPALATALLVSIGAAAPAHAASGPAPYPAPHEANAEFLDAACAVPAHEDPSVLVMVHRVARRHDANDKVMLAAFEAGWVESHMNNLDCGDSDSLGVFQQRPSQGWGSPEQIMDPVYAATQFVTRAIANDRAHPEYTAGRLAQSVQRSAYPGRYDEAESLARGLMGAAARTADMLAGSPADFTGDGKDDIVTFTKNAAEDAFVATSTGTAFAGTTQKWHDTFGLGGETTLTGDFTGDGKDDIVAFTHGAEGDVWVAPSQGGSFGTAAKWHEWFAPRQEVAAVGDVNGDGKDDIVAFTHNAEGDVWVALSNGTSFGPGQLWNTWFAPAGEYPAVGDVDGDGKADLISFTQGTTADVWVARSTGTSFTGARIWHSWFAPGAELPRVGDFDGDGKADIATFTQGTTADVYVALSTGSSFGDGRTAPTWHGWFAPGGEFPYVGDYDGDGKDDIVTFTKGGTNDVWVALSNGSRFGDGATAGKWHDFFGLPGETTL
ncbi:MULTISPECIES: FG-GAP repeat domain-containing protein [Streptomyces]|uniref:FG-GAP repeat domain-containing protein n=3 Tax=Streptomyces eurythermus TaxID=42237 RepID=A0ABW6YS64_9ACTN|nr:MULTISPECIES: VCBS repeat-containing protein [Streptomyces]